MVMASNTNDIDEKKLIYFYLGIYAEEYSDVAIMAINTFIKGCSHTDFRIRGLSLKSLCSLKFRGAE
jgi:AP-4 complex subunit beta-1